MYIIKISYCEKIKNGIILHRHLHWILCKNNDFEGFKMANDSTYLMTKYSSLEIDPTNFDGRSDLFSRRHDEKSLFRGVADEVGTGRNQQVTETKYYCFIIT
jgi:hypothetical protein